jgi:hypothetical protein
MQFTQHPTTNKLLGAPENWDHGKGPCEALPVTVIPGDEEKSCREALEAARINWWKVRDDEAKFSPDADETWLVGNAGYRLGWMARATGQREAPELSDEQRNAIKERIAGLAFICEISDTGQLVDHVITELQREVNGLTLPADHEHKEKKNG